ncbi:MAG: class I SAM-dependent methyltransferase [Kordiimonas sp.]
MRPDVLSIHRFYESPLGQKAAGVIGERMLGFLPRMSGMTTVGLGYALPFLDLYSAEETGDVTTRTLAFMPDRQGVCHWPSMENCRSSLVDPFHLPLADSSVDRLLLVHALEHAHKPTHMLREVWRVLAPGGQVLVIVPNRLRTWSAAEATPFGHGKPYSKGQLFRLMTDQMLPPDDWCTVLMLPPFQWRGAPRFMNMGERVIRKLGNNLGGALIVCARKQVYGALPKQASKVRGVPVLTHSS